MKSFLCLRLWAVWLFCVVIVFSISHRLLHSSSSSSSSLSSSSSDLPWLWTFSVKSESARKSFGKRATQMRDSIILLELTNTHDRRTTIKDKRQSCTIYAMIKVSSSSRELCLFRLQVWSQVSSRTLLEPLLKSLLQGILLLHLSNQSVMIFCSSCFTEDEWHLLSRAACFPRRHKKIPHVLYVYSEDQHLITLSFDCVESSSIIFFLFVSSFTAISLSEDRWRCLLWLHGLFLFQQTFKVHTVQYRWLFCRTYR